MARAIGDPHLQIQVSRIAHQNRYIIHRYLACPLHFPRLMSGATSRPKISLRESTSSDPDPSLWKPSKNCSSSRANLSYLEPIPSPAAQVGRHPQNSHQEKRGRLSGGGRHRLSLRTTSDIYLSPKETKKATWQCDADNLRYMRGGWGGGDIGGRQKKKKPA